MTHVLVFPPRFSHVCYKLDVLHDLGGIILAINWFQRYTGAE